ncbi:MAG TPA: hypothetical protein VNA12_02130 [Mycobacteriales bacterium]|nr:hypothetical protein [Mycobacteriales bacterium]
MGNPTAVQVHDVPRRIREAGPAEFDYVDLFVAAIPRGVSGTPEQWARATMEGASPVGRFLAWQSVLGLRLDKRPAPDRVVGWQIVDRREDSIRVEAQSWLITANMLFHVTADEVSFATFVRFHSAFAAGVWGAVSVVHRAVAPDFLRSGVRRVARGYAGYDGRG